MTLPLPLRMPAQSLPNKVLRMAIDVDVLDNCLTITSRLVASSAHELPDAVELAALLTQAAGLSIAADATMEEAAACAVHDSPYLTFCSMRNTILEAGAPRSFAYYVIRNGARSLSRSHFHSLPLSPSLPLSSSLSLFPSLSLSRRLVH